MIGKFWIIKDNKKKKKITIIEKFLMIKGNKRKRRKGQ